MKLLAIGDFHGCFPPKLKDLAKDVDLILCTGDFGGSDDLLNVLFKNLGGDWIENVGEKKAKSLIEEDYESGKKILKELNDLKKPVYFVFGNWDFDDVGNYERFGGFNLESYVDLIKKEYHFFNFIHKRNVFFKNISIFGYGGMTVASSYVKEKTVMSSERRKDLVMQNKNDTEELFKYSKFSVDVFLAHYPPEGVFDKVVFKGYNPMNGKHVGFSGYRTYIFKRKPKVFICGHMHEYQGMRKLGDTLVVSTGAAKDGKAALISIDGGVKVEFID